MIQVLTGFGYTCSTILVEKMLYLKTGVAFLGDNKLILAGELASHQTFKDSNKIIIDDDESYAANCVCVNDYVIMPAGYKKSKKTIIEAGLRKPTFQNSGRLMVESVVYPSDFKRGYVVVSCFRLTINI